MRYIRRSTFHRDVASMIECHNYPVMYTVGSADHFVKSSMPFKKESMLPHVNNDTISIRDEDG